MTTDEFLIQQMDELLNNTYPVEKPGASVIVTKDSQILLRKGYGRANLELDVSVEPYMVFRLGSITKQFTAVCILILLERRLLDLQDEITRYLPDYPSQGRKITIEHLLTHTSGVKSYTDMPEWLPLWRKDMSIDELITLFKDQPMEFEPGERFQYNNSGYILLGAIIEKLSGFSYADFVQKNIFDRLDMTRSLYDDPARLISGRVAGYTKGTDGFENAPYLSMSQPYAAGALASCVDDLAKWDAALYTDILVNQGTLDRAFKSGQLNNGEPTGYGYGWMIGEYEGYQFIEHGGGINGFTTGAVRVPDARVYVAVLTNLETPNSDPSTVAFRLATLAIGKPWVEQAPIELTEEALDIYPGVYQINEREERVIMREGLRLFSQRTGGMRLEIFPCASDTFFFKDNPDRFVFTHNESGKVNGMKVIRRIGPPEVAPRTNKPLPSQRSSIILPVELLKRYIGEFELAPGLVVTVSLSDDHLFIQAPGQEKLPLLFESTERLFTQTVDLTLVYEFNALGEVKSFVLHQGLQTYPARKLR
jgi:CubicO group peptidase (beta-lactamase class C family)